MEVFTKQKKYSQLKHQNILCRLKEKIALAVPHIKLNLIRRKKEFLNGFITPVQKNLIPKNVSRNREPSYFNMMCLNTKYRFNIAFKLRVIIFKDDLLFLHIPWDLIKTPSGQSLFCKYMTKFSREKKGALVKKDQQRILPNNYCLNFI